MVLNSVFGKWNFQQLSTLTPIMEEGWFSFDSWEENPLINGNPKVVRFPTYFSESAPFQSILLWHHLWWKDGFLFIHGRRNSLLTGTQKLYGFEVTFREVKLFTVISFDTTYGGKMAFISFMGGEPPYKREPESWTVLNSVLGKKKISTVVYFDTSYGGRMVSFHSWEDNPFINGNRKVVWWKLTI